MQSGDFYGHEPDKRASLSIQISHMLIELGAARMWAPGLAPYRVLWSRTATNRTTATGFGRTAVRAAAACSTRAHCPSSCSKAASFRKLSRSRPTDAVASFRPSRQNVAVQS